MNNTLPSRSEFLQQANAFAIVPLVRTLHSEAFPFCNPLSLYHSIRSDKPGFILESAKGGTYSYVGIGGEKMVESRSGANSSVDSSGARHSSEYPFDFLRRQFTAETIAPHPALRDFSGGGVGYLTYDFARSIERLPELAFNDLNLPDLRFIFPDTFFVFDHPNSQLHLVALIREGEGEGECAYATGLQTLAEMEEQVRESEKHTVGLDELAEREEKEGKIDSGLDLEEEVSGNLTPEEFHSIVQRGIEYILAGDIFQVNLSVRFSRAYNDDPLRLYRTLRRINPAPYMTFLEFDDHAIVGASPELLLKVSRKVDEKGCRKEIVTRPIAGTRKRGANEEEDAQKIQELIENEKERAEHVMLVDLERNDVGRVARYGSVHVDEFMAIEKYSHVIHIVSNVRGELADGKDVFDAIRGAFPGGTITGAPKIRSMEIIEELEPHRRGIYTGSIGWIGFNGDAELNIAIRTMLVKDGVAHAQAGAGIVADSVPEYEYKESLRKAQAALKALQETVESP